MAKARVAWGIDIGNRALKAVKLVRAGEGVRIDEIEVIEHENILSNAGDNREQLIQNALALFTTKHALKGAPAAIGVSGQQSFARFIKLPPVEEKKIPEIVRFEAIQQIPFPLDEVEWSYHLFKDETSPDVDVGIFAMRKELVNQHLAYFGPSGVNVQAVQMSPLAVYNALRYDGRFKDGATMVIDLGAENADLIIAEGESVWMRSIPLGGNHFTEALVRDFKLRFERAEELKRTTATSPHGRRILQAMRPVFADLVSEIQRSIGFYSSTHRDSRISKVIALGGTFKLPGLQKYLQQNLGLDVIKLEGLSQEVPADSKIAAALSENLLSTAGAYGLALQAMGEAKINSSLLPSTIQKERVWKQKIPWFAAAAACFVVGSAVPFFVLGSARSSYESGDRFRTETTRILKDAKKQSDYWKQTVEQGGDAGKAKIAEIRHLTDHRTVWSTLMAPPDNRKDARFVLPVSLGWTVPAGARTSATMPAVKTPSTRPAKRSDRTDIVLDQLQVQYFPRVSEMMAKFNSENDAELPRDVTSVLSTFVNQGVPQGIGTGIPGVGTGLPVGPAPTFPTGPIGTGLPMGPGMAGPSPTTVDPNEKRGFYLTLYLMTPNGQARSLAQREIVDQLVRSEEERKAIATKLKSEGKVAEAQRLFPFRIAGVKVYRDRRLDQDQVLMAQLAARSAATLKRKRGGGGLLTPAMIPGATVPGGIGGIGAPGQVLWPPAPPPPGGTTDPALITNPPVNGIGAGIPTGPTAADEAAERERLLTDPETGESIKQDYILIVLIAIELDPWYEPPAPPPAEAAPDPNAGGGGGDTNSSTGLPPPPQPGV